MAKRRRNTNKGIENPIGPEVLRCRNFARSVKDLSTPELDYRLETNGAELGRANAEHAELINRLKVVREQIERTTNDRMVLIDIIESRR